MRYSFKEKFRYWFDSLMSKGLIALVGLLGLASFLFVSIVATVVLIFNFHPEGERLDFGEAFWASLLRTLDPGTMGADRGTGFRGAMLVVTIGGIILVASLISIIANAFNTKVDNLRKGKSRVLEKDHTIVLGWNSKVVSIIQELCIANQSRKNSSIVILCERDKVETEEEINTKITNRGKTKIIVRSGDPMSLYDLEITNHKFARSIIVLSPDNVDDPDAAVIRTTLALVNNPHRKEDKYHLVGEIKDLNNLEAAKLVGRDEADWILSEDVISRITVQTSRQSGLSSVFNQLLDFAGDEIYISSEPALIGSTFLECQHSFEKSIALGYLRNEKIILNPQAEEIYREGDQLILISEDDTTIEVTEPLLPEEWAITNLPRTSPRPEKTLIIGYNNRIKLLLSELDAYSAPQSTVLIVSECPIQDFPKFKNLKVEMKMGKTTNRDSLEAISPLEFQHVVVLAYSDNFEPERADAKTLITLLHLRDIFSIQGKKLNIVSEMMDDKNRQLAEVTDADDFIVSDKLISLLMSQLAENSKLADVFESIFSSSGSEICLKSAEKFVGLGSKINFYTVVEAASRRGETVIGYRKADLANSPVLNYGVKINPNKNELISFASGDKIIVLADE